jgi:hypothetical protein
MSAKASLPDPNDLVALYTSGKSFDQLARIFHADTRTLRNIIVENGGVVRKPGERIETPLPDWIDIAISRYQSGEGLTNLSREYRVSPKTFKRWLQDRNIPIRNFAEGAQISIDAKPPEWWEKRGKAVSKGLMNKINLPVDEIIQRYQSGVSENSLAQNMVSLVPLFVRD